MPKLRPNRPMAPGSARRSNCFRSTKDKVGHDNRLIPTAEIVDSSNDFGGWYRAPGWRAAARRTKPK
jgi:hypothetical protein